MTRIEKIGSRIDLGCGEHKQNDCIGIDNRDFGQEIVWDVRNGLPFPDNSIEYIYSCQFFEHLTLAEINFVCWDLKRVAKEGCVLDLIVPKNNYDIAHYSYWDTDYIRGLCVSWGVKIEHIEERDGNIVAQITL